MLPYQTYFLELVSVLNCKKDIFKTLENEVLFAKVFLDVIIVMIWLVNFLSKMKLLKIEKN